MSLLQDLRSSGASVFGNVLGYGTLDILESNHTVNNKQYIETLKERREAQAWLCIKQLVSQTHGYGFRPNA